MRQPVPHALADAIIAAPLREESLLRGKNYYKKELTPPQLQVLQHMANGLDRSEAAAAEHYSLNSIKGHLREATRKLEARSTSHAVAIALRRGLIT